MAEMKRTVKKLVYAFFILIFLNIFSVFADERVVNLQSVVLEDFELDESGKQRRLWIVVPDRFGREGNLDSGKSLQQLAWITAWPEAYFGRDGVFDDGNEKREYKTSLGLLLNFNRKGYNKVELIPVVEKDGKYVNQPIPFKGRVQEVDLWIWGANYNYAVEMILRDFRGVEHRLPVGNINHVGWKNFKVTIPPYIPQSISYIPALKVLSLVKLEIWTQPNEQITGCYVYFDHIKYLSDLMESKYDGYNLGVDETAKNLWEKAVKGPDNETGAQ